MYIINDTHRQISKFRTQGWRHKQEYLTDKEYIEYHVKTEGGQIVKVKLEQEEVEQESNSHIEYRESDGVYTKEGIGFNTTFRDSTRRDFSDTFENYMERLQKGNCSLCGQLKLELAKEKLAKEKILKNKSSLLRKIQDANILVVHCNGRLKFAKEKIFSLEGRARKNGTLHFLKSMNY